MYIWLSRCSEGVPEKDNEIACQVIWFENSSHLWTGVWANKPRVCQDSFFALLHSLHLSLQDVSEKVPSTEREVGNGERAQVTTDSGWVPAPDGVEHVSVVQSSIGEMQETAQWSQCLLTGREAAVTEPIASVPPKLCSVGLWTLALPIVALWSWRRYITFPRLSFPVCKVQIMVPNSEGCWD